MIYGSSVTIVVLSPNMRESAWMDWEVRYSLRQAPRNGRASRTNGVVCVLGRYYGGYEWLRSSAYHEDGHRSVSYDESKLLDIIRENRANKLEKQYFCRRCGILDSTWDSYASIVTEDDFLANPQGYIEAAFEKSQREGEYEICKNQR